MTTTPTDRTPRADAQRNRALIVNATLSCLATDPRASMTAIARAAGVGRVTLYGHFSSRKDLVEAAAAQAIADVEAKLALLDLHGNPREALTLLAASSWCILDGVRGLVTAAEEELGTDRISEHHDQALLRVRRLIERGQTEGDFRTDQSAAWLTACYFAILHGAAAEVRAGRLPLTISALVSPPAAAA
jgi:AcrR family transcriptional regulator